jgi:hypothetical protein
MAGISLILMTIVGLAARDLMDWDNQQSCHDHQTKQDHCFQSIDVYNWCHRLAWSLPYGSIDYLPGAPALLARRFHQASDELGVVENDLPRTHEESEFASGDIAHMDHHGFGNRGQPTRGSFRGVRDGCEGRHRGQQAERSRAYWGLLQKRASGQLGHRALLSLPQLKVLPAAPLIYGVPAADGWQLHSLPPDRY